MTMICGFSMVLGTPKDVISNEITRDKVNGLHLLSSVCFASKLDLSRRFIYEFRGSTFLLVKFSSFTEVEFLFTILLQCFPLTYEKPSPMDFPVVM